MSEKFDKLLELKDDASKGEELEYLMAEWALDAGEISTSHLAISGDNVSVRQQNALAFAIHISTPQGMRMMVTMFGMLNDLSQVVYSALTVMLGHMVQEGYITFTNMPPDVIPNPKPPEMTDAEAIAYARGRLNGTIPPEDSPNTRDAFIDELFSDDGISLLLDGGEMPPEDDNESPTIAPTEG